jgi:hypothetical protein
LWGRLSGPRGVNFQGLHVDWQIVDELTPRNVHGYFTRLLAQRMGSDLIVDSPGADSVRLSVTLAG